MWELAKVPERDVKQILEYLGEGYEPFAVSTDVAGWDIVCGIRMWQQK